MLCIIVWVGWRFRARIHPIAFWGAGHFTASVGPFLGLLTFAYMGTSFVADRFFYMATIGLFAPLSLGVELLLRRLPRALGRPEMARECFLAALRKDPGNSQARRNFSALLSESESEQY